MGTILFSSAFFVSYAYSPYVSTGSATAITSSSATLNGSINADNMPTSVWFEYGTDSSLKNSLSVNAYRYSSGYSGNIVANIGGLYQNTTYYFRAVAQNGDGRVYGNIYSFATNYNYPVINDIYAVNTPLVLTAITESASFIENTSVQLNSLIYNEASNPSKAWFEWGTTVNLGNKTEMVSIGTFPSVRHANIMTGLSSGTTYYFRAVAENSTWRNNGSVLSFVTSGAKLNVGAKTSAVTSTDIITTNTPTIKTDPAQASLAANVLGSDSFLPVNVFGWLLLIIFILVLIILSKHLYHKFSDKKGEGLAEKM